MTLSFFKKWRFFFILIFLCGLYITYPYMTLWSISKAIQTNDTKKLSTFLDWQSIKQNLQTDLTKAFQETSTSGSELPEFGNSFATTAISNAINNNLTPENLTNFINRLKQESSPQESSTINVLLQSFMTTHIHFLSPTSLQAETSFSGQKNEDPIQMTMRLQHWRWKVVSFKFSEKHTFQLFQQSN